MYAGLWKYTFVSLTVTDVLTIDYSEIMTYF